MRQHSKQSADLNTDKGKTISMFTPTVLQTNTSVPDMETEVPNEF